MSGRAGRTIARRFSERVQPGLTQHPAKEAKTADPDRFRKLQRRRELRALEEQARERHANIDKWFAAERKKIEAKYR